MSRRLVALSLPVLALFAVAARKPDHPKHENHYKAVTTPAAGELASKGPSIFGKALVLIPPGAKKGIDAAKTLEANK